MAKGKQPNMKVNVTADNSDLSRKMKDSKAAVKDFEKVSGGALDGFASTLGVNVGKVEQLTSAVRGLGEKMQQSSNEGTKALGALLKSIDGISAGIAGIGIGAVVAGFKMLSDEAENFKSTIEGANIEMATAAYIDTYRQVIHDFNQETGKGIAQAESNWKKFWGTLGANWKAYISSGALSAVDVPMVNTEQADAYAETISAAGSAAQDASAIIAKMYDIQVQLSNKTVEWKEMERQIAEYKRVAYDKSVDTVTQQEALNKATQLIEQRYKEEARLKKQLADLQFQYNDLASSSLEDIQKANQLRVDELATIELMNNKLRELQDREATIKQNAEKEAEAREQALEYAEAMAKSRAELADWAREAGLDKPIVPDIEIPPVEVKVDDSNVKLPDIEADVVVPDIEIPKVEVAPVDVNIPDIEIPPVEVKVDDSNVKLPDVTVGVKLPIDELQQSVTELSPLLSEAFDEVSDAVQPAQQMSSIFQVAAGVVAGMSDDIAAIAGGLKAISTTASASVSATYTGPADIKSLLPKGAEALAETGIAIPITPELDMSGVVDITNELQSVMTSAFDMIGVSLGELIGDLATGGDAWGNFANTAIGAFGDMAISIGKMAISTGVATLGIKAALESLNGYVAIAAGTALVALGAAVKAGLSNIASGSYSSSANVATAGGYGSTSMLGADFETREMKVEVTGTLRASGNELLTVIENENTRKKHTT